MEKRKYLPSFKNPFFARRFFFLSIAQSFVSLLLGGEICLRCSRRTLRIPLCPSCLPLLGASDKVQSCIRCGRELISEISVCTRCRDESALKSLEKSFSIHSYQLWKKALLYAWKIDDKRGLSPFFAEIFYKKLKKLEEAVGFPLAVVPVPPRKDKIRQRGWDQIDELCFYLKNGWGVKILPLLERLSRIQQKKLDRTQRIEGMATSYRLKDEKKLRKIAPRLPEAVVLADDVLTTGATIEACGRELKKAGIQNVFSITLFIVD
ncbi:MAG: ComF family protein [Treponema sp.]|uniref:ComF family protein n=1 Tax=Treponema sp. TaxID=166 RepID=UPI001B6D626F|nr:hypothetical protein [Treponema sp.]MBP3773116.1 ComF family protein [Treponema sp.]MBQ9282119.1 ComF family protein [Treponema sp.]